MCTIINDDVTDFGIRGFKKNRKIEISLKRNVLFSSNKKLVEYTLGSKLWQKNSFVAAVAFIMFLDKFNLDKTRILLHATFSKIEL